MKRLRAHLGRYPLAAGFVLVGLMAAGLSIPVPNTIAANFAHEAAVAVVVVLAAGLLSANGFKALCPSPAGLGFGLKKSAYLLAVALLLAAGSFAALHAQSSGVAEGWLVNLLLLAGTCLSIGIVEETVFRFVLLNGFLSRWGTTGKGLMGAVVASSLIFGSMHVAHSVIMGEVSGVPMILQSAGKTVQTGMLGMLFAAVYLTTRNLTPLVIAHALMDFMLEIPFVLFSGSMSSASYVASDPSQAMAGALGYLVICALYLPVIVQSVRMVNRAQVPFAGALREPVEPQRPSTNALKIQRKRPR